MESSPEGWADHYDPFKLAAILAASDRIPELTGLLRAHIEEHPGEQSTPAQSLLTALPNMYFATRSEDDAGEYDDGEMVLESSDLEMMYDDERQYKADQKLGGMRFADIRIPRGTQIQKAYLQFAADEAHTEPTELTIHAELAASAEEFGMPKGDISSRKKTEASVKWSPEPWELRYERSEKQRTPDLSSLIQEVVSQPDWREGNALVLIISGSGKRDATLFDGRYKGGPPMLYVEH